MALRTMGSLAGNDGARDPHPLKYAGATVAMPVVQVVGVLFGVLVPLWAVGLLLAGVPALCRHVPRVVSMATDEEVVRVAARRVVAAMAAQFIRTQWLTSKVTQEPSVRTGVASGHSEAAVPAGKAACDPWPAGVRAARAVDAGPEAVEVREVTECVAVRNEVDHLGPLGVVQLLQGYHCRLAELLQSG